MDGLIPLGSPRIIHGAETIADCLTERSNEVNDTIKAVGHLVALVVDPVGSAILYGLGRCVRNRSPD
jgi:hypothetical protein